MVQAMKADLNRIPANSVLPPLPLPLQLPLQLPLLLLVVDVHCRHSWRGRVPSHSQSSTT